MTRAAVIICGIGFLCLCAGAQAQNLMGSLLTEIEETVNWREVNPTWKDKRSGWMDLCRDTQPTDVPQLGNLVLALEEAIFVKKDAMEDGWADRRPYWRSHVQKATTTQRLATLLIEFESNVRLVYVNTEWRAARKGWIDSMSRLQ